MPTGRRKPTAAPTRTVPKILRLYAARGMPIAALLRAVGLPPDAAAREELAIAPDQFEALLAAGAAALGDPLLAIHLPATLDADAAYSVGELAARASPDLGEALARIARYARLFYAHLAFSVERREGELVFRLSGPGSRHANEFALATSLFHAERIVAAPIAPVRVFFAHPEVPEVDGLRAHFGTRAVDFGCGESGLVFRAADAARRSIGHEPRLLVTAELLADRALAERPPPADLARAVTAELRAALADGAVSAAAVARRLRLGTRTLQRRLDDEGVSFAALLDGVRRDVALEAVRDPAVDLAEVARRAGFSDIATFSRAFKRWTGRPPGAYRREGG